MADTISDVEAVARRDFDIEEKMWCDANGWKHERARKWEQLDDWERKSYADSAVADLAFIRSLGYVHVEEAMRLATYAKTLAFEMRNEAEQRNDSKMLDFFRGRVTAAVELESAIRSLTKAPE